MRTLAISVIALLFCSVNAYAGDNGLYLGGAISQSTIDTNDSLLGFGFEDDDDAYKLIAGIRPTDTFGIEANYINFGNIIFDDRDIVIDGIRAEYESEAIDLFAVAHFGGPFVEVIGKLGVVYWDASALLQGGISGSNFIINDTGTDFAYGAGIQLQFSSFATRFEYENFEIDGVDTLELWSLGITWTFF